MTLDQAKDLCAGDQVFWEDPDDGVCSRAITIQSVRVDGEIVSISDADGSIVECFVDELRRI